MALSLRILATTVFLLPLLAPRMTAQGEQVGTITGHVTRPSGLPVDAAQVSVVGTTVGAMTDANGAYTLTRVPAGPQQLKVQRIGFAPVVHPVTVKPNESVTLDVQLNEAAVSLDQVVVTGTAGAARLRELGNSISQVDVSKQIGSPTNVDALLQAQAPGMTVLVSSGQPGSAAQIRLRGNVSVAMSNQPLVYIDGVRTQSDPYRKNVSAGESDNRSNNDVQSPLNDINPADIDHIEIIKGAAATTLYGTDASAGVIQIFTKRGLSGKPQWSADVEQGFSQLQPFAPSPAKYAYLDPWLKKGRRQRYGLTVRGGTDALDYFVSGLGDVNDGVLPNDHEERESLRSNFTFPGFKGMKIQWNNFITRSATRTTPTGNNSHGLTLNVYRGDNNFFGTDDPEVISQVLQFDTRSMIDRLTSGLTFTYNPIESWSNRFTIGYDYTENELRSVRPFGFPPQPLGRMSDILNRSKVFTLDLVSTYDIHRLFVEDLHLSVSGGAQSVTVDDHTLDGLADQFPGPGTPTLSSGAIRQSFESASKVVTGGLFGQLLFNYLDRYFLTLGMRVDGNSAFGEDFGFQKYPKASLSYVISDESFWPEKIGTLKLRAAYGQSGRAPGAFDAVRTWDPIGWGGLPAYIPLNLGNPDLGPERTAETEVGFDYSAFSGRLSVGFTRFHQRTTDALFPVQQAPSLGFRNSQLRNVGVMENNGIEVALSGIPYQSPSGDYRVDVGLNIAKYKNKAVDLGGASEFSLGGQGWIIEGQPLPVIRGVKLMNPDEIADPITQNDYIFGPNLPDLTISPSISVQLPHGIAISARGEYQGGGYIFDSGTENAQSRGITVWPTCLHANAEIEAGRGDQLTAYERQFCIVSNFKARSTIYPTDFFKLRELSVRVGIPTKWVPGATGASLTFSARNWYRWVNDDFKMFDPEMMANDGARSTVRSMNEQYPAPAVFTWALRANF
jgi:outer membrane receptor protein involved in Fe transport